MISSRPVSQNKKSSFSWINLIVRPAIVIIGILLLWEVAHYRGIYSGFLNGVGSLSYPAEDGFLLSHTNPYHVLTRYQDYLTWLVFLFLVIKQWPFPKFGEVLASAMSFAVFSCFCLLHYSKREYLVNQSVYFDVLRSGVDVDALAMLLAFALFVLQLVLLVRMLFFRDADLK